MNPDATAATDQRNASSVDSQLGSALPGVTLPKGGGAIRGIGEKFTANPATGTGSMTVPIAASAGRAGFAPQLTLSYDSGSGNGPFGLGWSLALPMVSRKTDKGLPTYDDLNESDVYLLSGAEDLAPEFRRDANGALIADAKGNYSIIEDDRTIGGATFRVRHYRPRTEGLFSRVERWTRLDNGVIHWRSISKDNVTTLYGYDAESRIADPTEPTRIFSWLICSTFDDKGQVIRYLYKREDSTGIDLTHTHEGARTTLTRTSQIYPYKVFYGNAASVLDATGMPPQLPPALNSMAWYFEIAFDYGEGYLPAPPTNPAAQDAVEFAANPSSVWLVRPDPFSHYRATFEVRTYRRCQRVLMIHHFPTELGAPDCLIASTDLVYDDSPYGSAVISITQSGYVRQADGSYLRRGLPAVELEYSPSPLEHFTVDDFEVRELDTRTIANLGGKGVGSRILRCYVSYYRLPAPFHALFCVD
jgi:Salmonella virulence plasmid 65kDa B protein